MPPLRSDSRKAPSEYRRCVATAARRKANVGGSAETGGMAAADATRVYLEVGKQKVFAAAIDWPGWARSGRDEESALEALASYLARYAPVARRAGLATPSEVFVVTERIAGSSTTDFGVLEKVAAADLEPVSASETKQLA